MYPEIIGDKVYMGRKSPQLIKEIDTGNEYFISYMFNYKIDLSPHKYYVVNKDRTEYYVLWYDGCWCWDGALYQDRLIIATELDLTRDQAWVWKEKY